MRAPAKARGREEMRPPMTFTLPRLCAAFALALSLLLGPAPASPARAAAEPARTIIILDGSGSMWGVAGGKRKLVVARETVENVMSRLPADREVGLMAYGHRRKGDCGDIELLVPPAANSGPAVREAVKSLRFLGMTPLSAALRKAAEALRYTEGPATVVLVTDGIETCDADPCATAAELEKAGVAFTAHVIGFGLTREEGAQVACIAQKTGGRYIEARDGASLDKALTETVSDAPPAKPEPQPKAATHHPGAPMMLNVGLTPTGRTTAAKATPVTQPSFPPTGTIAQCEAACTSDAACAAWRYDPKGSYFIDHARCALFDGATEFEIEHFDPADGWASGIKDGHRMLVRPYLIAVTFQADGADAPVSWSAVPAPGQTLPPEAWGAAEASADPVRGEFLPGTYDVLGTVTEGPSAGATFGAQVKITPTSQTAFTIPRAAKPAR